MKRAPKKRTNLARIICGVVILLMMVALSGKEENIQFQENRIDDAALFPSRITYSSGGLTATNAPILERIKDAPMSQPHDSIIAMQTSAESQSSPFPAARQVAAKLPETQATMINHEEVIRILPISQTASQHNIEEKLAQASKSEGSIEIPTTTELMEEKTSFNGTSSFGACLLWMDDYELLIEWIAYHYHVLPLRHLVLFRDPKSTKDPSPIFDRWRPYGMHITYWTSLENFTHFPNNNALEELKGNPQKQHIERQHFFYRNCLMHLKREKWGWTFVGDTDEFVLLNSKVVPEAREMMKQPGIIMETILKARTTNRIPNSNKHMNKRQLQRWGNPSRHCVCLQRHQFGGFESPEEAVMKDVPSFLDHYRFQTLRFRHHRRNTIVGKSIIDSSRIPLKDFRRMGHHSVTDECGSYWGDGDDLMIVNHYLGSWEYFRRDNDFRGQRRKRFLEKNAWIKDTLHSNRGDEIRQWMGGFVEHFGKEVSLSLLEGAGFPFNNETALETIGG
ncbi:unnamed protein product [Cylindrotheca closterium]|uniref:Uncharacterized protein n=1 Tax=Cylindrotheca closterium TaxID=2856 RepID=A0AAD2CFD3_9STRA|nr:unnamed protein product [Cylindrotheca closterium]